MGMFVRVGDVEQKFQEAFHFFEMPQIVEGSQRKVGIPQPTIPIVPIAGAGRLFRKTCRQRCQDGSGIFIAMEFQGQGRSNDFFLVQHGNRTVFNPHPPITGRLIEKLMAHLGEIIFDAQAPRQRKVRLLRQREGPFLIELGQGHVREQPKEFTTDFIADVAIAPHPSGRILGPARDRTAAHSNRRRAGHRFDDSK